MHRKFFLIKGLIVNLYTISNIYGVKEIHSIKNLRKINIMTIQFY